MISDAAKRSLDVCGALMGGLMLLPLLLFIACAVSMGSRLPVFFRQIRVGRHGRDFTLLKFRTMSVLSGTEKGSFEPGNTLRITRVGRWLRRTKLDELPQLWNVLWGDMSLVGPRPEIRKWVEAYPERWARVLVARPGITDPASIIFRNEEALLAKASDPNKCYLQEILPRKLEIYEEYVSARSFGGDLRILLRTIIVLVQRR